MPTIQESRKRARVERLQAHKISDNLYRVYNVEKGSEYEVIRTSGGVWVCYCPYGIINRVRSTYNGDCKHLTRVLERENGCIDCNRKDHLKRTSIDGPLKCAICRWEDRISV